MKKYTRKVMREMMEIRGLSPNTVIAYVGHIRSLAKYTGRPPHTLKPEDIHQYQVYLVHEREVSWSYFNQAVCAMRFFFNTLLKMIGLSHIFLTKRNIKHSL